MIVTHRSAQPAGEFWCVRFDQVRRIRRRLDNRGVRCFEDSFLCFREPSPKVR